MEWTEFATKMLAGQATVLNTLKSANAELDRMTWVLVGDRIDLYYAGKYNGPWTVERVIS
jgi:hypothetical protein